MEKSCRKNTSAQVYNCTFLIIHDSLLAVPILVKKIFISTRVNSNLVFCLLLEEMSTKVKESQKKKKTWKAKLCYTDDKSAKKVFSLHLRITVFEKYLLFFSNISHFFSPPAIPHNILLRRIRSSSRCRYLKFATKFSQTAKLFQENVEEWIREMPTR